MTPHSWTLARVYFERLVKAAMALAFIMTPLAFVFARKNGYRAADIALNLAVATVMLPIAAGGIVTKSKMDGSLAFLSSLPIARHEHAMSWLMVVATLSLPFALCAMFVASTFPVPVSGIVLVLTGLTALVFTTSAVMVMLATQLSAPPATAGLRVLQGFGVILFLIAGIGQFAEQFPTAWNALLRSAWFFGGLSASLWIIAAGAFWWAWHTIGLFMTSYVGDPPRA